MLKEVIGDYRSDVEKVAGIERNKTARMVKVLSMRSAPELGEPHAFHPLGKNPGDGLRDYLSRTEPYLQNNPHRERQFGKREAAHPLGKNPGDFWEITTQPFKRAHFAVYPERLCEIPIKSSCPPGGIVLDPFCGPGTTAVVAKKLGRNWIGIDLNPDYCVMARERMALAKKE